MRKICKANRRTGQEDLISEKPATWEIQKKCRQYKYAVEGEHIFQARFKNYG